MKKPDLIKKISSLELEDGEYCIISGGILVMYGIREETEDLDLYVSKKLFEKIKDKYELRPRFDKFPDLYELDSEVEVKVCDFSSDDVSYVDGYSVWSLEKQLEWMISNHRGKDKRNIQLIKDYLSKNS